MHCEEKIDAHHHFFCQKCLLELSVFFEESLTKSTEYKKFLFPIKGAARNLYRLAHDGQEISFLASFILLGLLHHSNPWIHIRNFVPKRKYSSMRWVHKEIIKSYPMPEDAFELCNLYFTMPAKKYAELEEKKGLKHLVVFLEV